jgi:hypothetical protein
MEKINEFIKKYGIIILVIILFVLGCFRNKITEPMICDLKRPKYNYFFDNYKHLIQKYNLRNKEQNLLKSLFDIDIFQNTNYVKDNKSLSKYVKVNNIEPKKDDFIFAVNEIINNNRMWDNTNNYVITLDSKISQVRHIWLLDVLLSDLKCMLEVKEINIVRTKLKEILKDKAIKLCSQKELLNYCSAVSANPKIGKFNSDTLEEEEKLLRKGVISDEDKNLLSIKDFKLVSIKDNVSKFGKGYYPEPLNSILEDLMLKFEEKYSRKLDNYDRNDLTKLALLYVPILQIMINKNLATPSSSQDKKKIEETLNINKELFYLIKHQYKLISIYSLINNLLTDTKEKELAYKCCVDSKDKKNMCYDFAQNKADSEPIVYGFDKYGYSKDTPCSPETNKTILDLQLKTLEARLSENSFWNNIPTDVKDKFYLNFKTLVNYFMVKKLDKSVNLSKTSIISLLGLLKEQNMDLILPENIETIPNENNEVDEENNEEGKLIHAITLSNTYSTIKKIAEKIGIDQNDFNFASLGENIPKLKLAVINLIQIRRLLLNYQANEGSVNKTMARMLGLVPTDFSYYRIMIKGGIPIRHHDTILSKFIKLLMKIRLIKLGTFTLSKKPKDVITYLENIFPQGKDLDICSIYKPILERLRTLRNITPKEYVYYKNNFNSYCDSRDSLLSKEKPILFKDINGTIAETHKKEIIDYNKNKIFVLTAVDSNGELEILNVNNKNQIEYSGLILRGGVVHSNKVLKDNTIIVNYISTDENKKMKIGKSKIRLESLVEDEVKDAKSASQYSANKVLEGTSIKTEIDDNNKNILNLIKNYFDFDKD